MQAKQMRNSAQLMEYLTQTHGISQTIIDDVYGYAKDNYEIGNYDECFEWYVFDPKNLFFHLGKILIKKIQAWKIHSIGTTKSQACFGCHLGSFGFSNLL